MTIHLPARWNNMPDSYLLTRKEIEIATGISASTLCNHSYAGLLSFIPGRPTHVRLGDFKRYAQMLSNGVAKKLHKSLRVEHQDRQAYSVLHGVAELTAMTNDVMVKTVVRETGLLWAKFKEKNAHKKKMLVKRSSAKRAA